MSWGEIAGMVAALAAVVFVALCAVPLLKLGGVMDELRLVVRNLGTSTTPILEELQGTVGTTTQEIARLSQVTDELTRMSQNATAMTEQAMNVSTVVSTPLVKTAEVVQRASTAARDVGRRVSERRGHRTEADAPPADRGAAEIEATGATGAEPATEAGPASAATQAERVDGSTTVGQDTPHPDESRG